VPHFQHTNISPKPIFGLAVDMCALLAVGLPEGKDRVQRNIGMRGRAPWERKPTKEEKSRALTTSPKKVNFAFTSKIKY
jgi:hypothetical protein